MTRVFSVNIFAKWLISYHVFGSRSSVLDIKVHIVSKHPPHDLSHHKNLMEYLITEYKKFNRLRSKKRTLAEDVRMYFDYTK